MKKALLFLLCALVSIGTRAQDVTGTSTGTMRNDWATVDVEIQEDAGLNNFTGSDPANGTLTNGFSLFGYSQFNAANFSGDKISPVGLSKIFAAMTNNNLCTFDFSECPIVIENGSIVSIPDKFKKIVFYPGTDLSSYTLANCSKLEYAYSGDDANKEGIEVSLYVGTVTELSQITELTDAVLVNGTKINLYGEANESLLTALKEKVGEGNVIIIKDKSVIETTVGNLNTDVTNYFKEYGENAKTYLKKLVVTGGTFNQASFELLAGDDLKDVNTVDLTNATLPDDVRFKDGTTVNWEVLVLPTGTKIAPNLKCYPKLKLAYGGGFNKIWLISRYDPTTEGSKTLRESGIDALIPEEIKGQDKTARIGVAFVGYVEPEDVEYFVGSGTAPLKNARIWHLRDTEGLDVKKTQSLKKYAQGSNTDPTGLVLPLGMDVNEFMEDTGYDYLIGNIYSLSKDEKDPSKNMLTLTAYIRNTSTFEIARFTTMNTKRVVLKGATIDQEIIKELKSTKRAIVADLSELKFPDRQKETGADGKNIPDDQILSGVTTGTIRRIRIPVGINNFTIDTYNGTTFGVIARKKKIGETDTVAVVYQRVPGTLAYTAEFRNDAIKNYPRIRYRGMASWYDLSQIFNGNANKSYDLSDLEIVRYKDEKYMKNPPIGFNESMVYRHLNDTTDMSVIKNNSVKYIALPAGTKIPDSWKLGFEDEDVTAEDGTTKKVYKATRPGTCTSLCAVGVLNKEKGDDTDVDKTRNTISIYSYEGGSTAPVVDMLTDKTDFDFSKPSSTGTQSEVAAIAESENTAEGTDNATNTTNVPVRHIVMGGKLFFCDITNNETNSSLNKETGHYNPASRQKTNSMPSTGVDEAVPAALAEGSVEGTESNAKYDAAFLGHGDIFNFTDADLTNALFADADKEEYSDDLTLSAACSFDNCTEIWLPVDHRQTTIPAYAFNGSSKFVNLTQLCIPGNIKKIKESAFYQCGMQVPCVTTTKTDENGNGFYGEDKSGVINNGIRTVTLPEELDSIETRAFHFNNKITDVYALATKAPACAKDAFTSVAYTGNNSFFGVPVRRESYVDPEEGNCYAVLHYPARASIDEAKNYTDITRKYTLADSQGDTDGNGNLKMWPSQADWNFASVLAATGYTWNAMEKGKNKSWDYATLPLVDKNLPPTYDNLTAEFKTALNDDAENYKYTSDKYMGWHQFVLVNTVYMADPNIKRVNASRFKANDWYSICVPYNLRKSDLLEVFGAKAGEDGKVTIDGKTYTGNKYPEVCTLVGVTRNKTTGVITLKMSKNLVDTDYTMNDNWTGVKEYTDYPGTDPDPVVVEAGSPYLIHPYLPQKELDLAIAGERVVSIKKEDNLRAEVMFPDMQHKVTALDEGNNVLDGKDGREKWEYQFIGHYYNDKNIPAYTYFIGKSKSQGKNIWFYNPDNTAKISWPQYVAVIFANASVKTKIPTDTEAKEEGKNPSIYFEGEVEGEINDGKPKSDDFTTGTTPSGAKSYQMVFDTGDTETTGISDIDADKAADNSCSDGKVYSISGQYVGDTLSGLSKGIYIMNGKKYVVE